MEKLNKLLAEKIQDLNSLKPGQFDLSREFLDRLYSVYPFNQFEYVISHLISERILTIQQYIDLRAEYHKRNKYLYLFEITAPRMFGETWAQRHVMELVPELELPSRKLDPEYSGQYDLFYKGIRIEVKASRAVKRGSGDAFVLKALSSDSKFGFDMNFQQIKPKCCDVFVWIAVWRDVIRYWVLSSADVECNKYYSVGQHRGNVGEGQLWIKETNIDEFKKFEVSPRNILDAIIHKAGRLYAE